MIEDHKTLEFFYDYCTLGEASDILFMLTGVPCHIQHAPNHLRLYFDGKFRHTYPTYSSRGDYSCKSLRDIAEGLIENKPTSEMIMSNLNRHMIRPGEEVGRLSKLKEKRRLLQQLGERYDDLDFSEMIGAIDKLESNMNHICNQLKEL